MSEWYLDYHGYVPIEAAAGLSRLIRETGMTFPDAYRALLEARKNIHIDPTDDLELPPEEPPDAVAPTPGAAKMTTGECPAGDPTAVQRAGTGD